MIKDYIHAMLKKTLSSLVQHLFCCQILELKHIIISIIRCHWTAPCASEIRCTQLTSGKNVPITS